MFGMVDGRRGAPEVDWTRTSQAELLPAIRRYALRPDLPGALEKPRAQHDHLPRPWRNGTGSRTAAYDSYSVVLKIWWAEKLSSPALCLGIRPAKRRQDRLGGV